MRAVAVLDMDGTLAPDRSLAGYLPLRHLPVVSFLGYKLGVTGYTKLAENALSAYGRSIRGRSREYVESRVKARQPKMMPFAQGLISLVRERGYTPIVISGSPEQIITPLSRTLGIRDEDVFATTYEMEKGLYTGQIDRIMIGKTKTSMLERYAQENGIDLNASTGFGNTVSDKFLFSVGFPVAISPDNELRIVASEKGWLICDHDDCILETVGDYLVNNHAGNIGSLDD